jgi:hypothetical protein
MSLNTKAKFKGSRLILERSDLEKMAKNFRKGKPLNKKVKAAIMNAVEDIDEHFKENSWDLDLSFYSSEVANKIAGCDIVNEIALACKTKGLTLQMGKRGLMLSKKPNRSTQSRKKIKTNINVSHDWKTDEY